MIYEFYCENALISAKQIADLREAIGWNRMESCYKNELMTSYFHISVYDGKKLGKDTYKITVEIFGDNTANYFANKYKECNMLKFSGESWCRLANKNADKVIALHQIIERLNISFSEAAAFGDVFNDIEMLKACGIGFAVDNAIAEAKEVANYICESNDNDGVARWIERNIF